MSVVDVNSRFACLVIVSGENTIVDGSVVGRGAVRLLLIGVLQ